MKQKRSMQLLFRSHPLCNSWRKPETLFWRKNQTNCRNQWVSRILRHKMNYIILYYIIHHMIVIMFIWCHFERTWCLSAFFSVELQIQISLFADDALKSVTVLWHISYCCEDTQCETGAGTAGWKMFFGEGIQLTVEASECCFSFNFHWIFALLCSLDMMKDGLLEDKT